MIVRHKTAVRTGVWGHCAPRAIGALALAFTLLAIVALPTMAATHALVVGVGRYADSSIKTLKADVDAEVVAAKLKELGASVTQLLSEQATKTAILGWFSTVHVYRGDLVYIYLAGHGGSVPDPSGRAPELGAFYPYDVKMNTLGGLSGGATADSAITENDLTYGISERLKGCHVVVFLDSCKSGLIAKEDPTGDSRLVVRGEGAFVPRGLASGVRDPDDPGITFVFASSDEHEPSFEDPTSEPPHGLFTRSLLNGLVCDADIAPADGTITYSELKAHVIRNMAELSESPARRGYVQTPVVLCSPEAPESESFALARQACQLTIRSVEAAVQSAIAVETPREEGDDELVVFPDPALDRAVRKALRKGEGEPITKGECRSVQWLIAAEKGIASLAGLEALTGLTNLDLRSNRISHLAPLAELTRLKFLDLSSNVIGDVKPLARLTQLTSLALSWNAVSDLKALSSLDLANVTLTGNPLFALDGLEGSRSLEYVEAQGCRLQDISALDGLARLGALYLSGNNISDISPLASALELRELDLNSNSIDSVAPLRGMRNLETLHLGYNDIDSLEPLRQCTSLRNLSAERNGLYDVDSLGNLTRLKSLDLSLNQIPDISVLANFTELEELTLVGCGVDDIGPLKACTHLRSLNLKMNRFTHVRPLSGLLALENLQLDMNEIVSVSPLAGLIGLVNLSIGSTSIADFAPLASLTNLRALSACGSGISNIRWVGGMVELRQLYLAWNRIDDLSPLSELRRLERLDVSRNSVKSISPLSQLRSLSMLNVDGNSISDITLLANLSDLSMLNACGNSISDITPLANLSGLEEIDLMDNDIHDVTPLQGLIRLEALSLARNQIGDIAPLAANVGLGAGDWVGLDDNPLDLSPGSDAEQVIEALEARGVIVTCVATPVGPGQGGSAEIRGRFEFAGQPLGGLTGAIPAVDVVDHLTREVIESAKLDYNPVTSEFVISGLPLTAVDFYVEVVPDEVEMPAWVGGDWGRDHLPGCYRTESFIDIAKVTVERLFVVVPLYVTMKLNLPIDNSMPEEGDGVLLPAVRSPVLVDWDPVPFATRYTVEVYLGLGASGDTPVLQLETASTHGALNLEPSKPGGDSEYYMMFVSAFAGLELIGEVHVVGSYWWKWHVDFRVR